MEDNLYLLYGENTYTLQGWLDMLIEKYIDTDLRAMNVTRYDGKGLEASTVLMSLQTLGFFGGRKITIVRDVFAMAEPEQARLAGELPKLSTADAFLVLVSGSVDKRRKLYSAVSKNGKAMEFKSLNPGETRKWLKNRLAKLHLRLTRDAEEYMLERDGHDLWLLHNDLEKLSLCYTGATNDLGVNELKDLISGVPEQGIFTLVDEIGKRNLKRSISVLSDIVLSNNDVGSVIGMIARQIRTMLLCKGGQASGLGVDGIAAVGKIHPFTVQKCIPQSKNFTEQQLIRGISRLSDVDIAVKTGKGEGKALLEQFIIDLIKSS